uniref:ORF2 n=1 Tax=Panagrellus redivivus TaxID=6233 RepID=A0A7E4V6F8_PANRE
MSSTSPQGAIQRFTYDWLIRFCELHITKPLNFVKTDARVIVYNTHIEPDPLSMFCKSNSLFAALTERYTPLVIKGDDIWFYRNPLTFPKGKKIVITGFVNFEGYLPGSLTNYMRRKIYFNPDRVVTMNSVMTPDEFTYILKQCKSFVPWSKTSLSKPVLCSELWPLLGHCTILKEDIVFPIVELILKQLIKHVELCFCHDDSNQSCESMVELIEKKFKAAGFMVKKRNKGRNNINIKIWMGWTYDVSITFYD